MFGKRDCKNCGEKVGKNYRFCPHCGNHANKKSKKENLGMLGENDFEQEFGNISNSFFGGMGGKMMGKMFESAMKILEKEMQKEMKKNSRQQPKTNFQIFINGEKVNLDSGHSLNRKIERPVKEITMEKLPRGNLKGFSTLRKKEPKTEIRRFSDRVIYEVYMPGVKSLKDVSVMNFENHIEIKATSKDKAYIKRIPIALPITNYEFSKGKLVLELECD
tara:strand:+ start:2005 stop:2661 length:657 start_codon:yes stop_codon:yes gene_type:complete